MPPHSNVGGTDVVPGELLDTIGPDKSAVVKSQVNDRGFLWSAKDEPHATRRKLIMKAHPEVTKLCGHCPKTKYKVLASVIMQYIIAYNLRNVSFPVLLLFTYFVSGSINHMMTLAIHELAHNLGFSPKYRSFNRYLAIFGNFSMGIPAAVSFKRYHLEHHKYQGEDDVDMDIPSEFEGWFFTTRPTKAIWVMLQPFFYSLRPLAIKPKQPGMWEYINFAAVGLSNAAVYYYCGGNGLFYLCCGTLIGMGVHPVAGHFIAEHYVLNPGLETMSYYGPLNWLTYNVGYHNEHHDFPNIPGSRLHLLRAMAPEFYDTLPQYGSWSEVIFDYITRKDIDPFSRIKRTTMTDDEKTELQRRELKAHLAS